MQDVEALSIGEHQRQQAVTTTQPWLVEAALWLKWLHVGTASSTTHCELLGLDAGKVQDADGISCGVLCMHLFASSGQ